MQNAKQEKEKSTAILTTPITPLLLLVVVCVSAAGYTIPAHADHGTLETFQTGDIQYMCNKNLSDLDYERIAPCTEFGKAAATWSTEISNLDMTNATSNAEITVVSGKFMMDIAVAKMTPYVYEDHLRHAVITFSTDYKWGDGTYWLHIFSRHDFQSIALHELGHVLGLDHDANSALMKENFAIWDVQRTIPAHDQITVQEKFGDD